MPKAIFPQFPRNKTKLQNFARSQTLLEVMWVCERLLVSPLDIYQNRVSYVTNTLRLKSAQESLIILVASTTVCKKCKITHDISEKKTIVIVT